MNCDCNQFSFSKDYQHYNRDAEIVKIKIDNKTTYYNARDIYHIRNPFPSSLHIGRMNFRCKLHGILVSVVILTYLG